MSMAMQQSGKGASGSGPNPVLSDEQADQFAASFTPAWDSGDDALPTDETNGGAAATLVDAVPVSAIAAAAATAQAAAPAPIADHAMTAPLTTTNKKQTLIGTAPQANPPNMNGVAAAAPAPIVAAPAPATSNEGRWQEKVPSRPPPPMQAPAAKPPAPKKTEKMAPVTADPFRTRAASAAESDTFDVPKKSKTIYFVIGGLAVAAGLGLFLKFALSDDTPKPATPQVALGPAATSAEIPPPPPKVDPPPPTSAVVQTAAKMDPPSPPPAVLPPPVVRAPDPPARVEPPPRAVAAAPGRPRNPVVQPPQPVVAPARAPDPPKTPPKSGNSGIVRDNPF